tara:strand:+ start:2939 stop:3151 length:213 start_codon:yes stop_codon:yes gene_type:complete
MYKTQITMDFKAGQQTMVKVHETEKDARRTIEWWRSWPHFVCAMLSAQRWENVQIHTTPNKMGAEQAHGV